MMIQIWPGQSVQTYWSLMMAREQRRSARQNRTRSRFGLPWMDFLLSSLFISMMASVGLARSLEHSPTEPSSAEGLSVALQATMQHHPAVKGKQAELKAQSGLLDSAKAGRYPNLSGQAQTLESGENTGSLRVRQPLWAFGRIDASIDQAQAQSAAEQSLLLQVQRDLIEQAAVAYTRIQSLIAKLAIAELNVQEHQRLLQRIETRQRGQLASVADVRLASSRMIRAQGDHQRLQGERDAALTELRRLTQVEVPVDSPLSASPLSLPTEVEIQRLATARHADLLVKRAQLEVAKWTVTNVQLADAPTLFFQVDQELLDTPGGVDRTHAGLVFEARTDGFGFATRGRANSAQARYQAAMFDRDSTHNDLRRRLETLLLNRSLQQRLQASQREAVIAVEETLASFIRQYDSGRKSWVEVLNTQREVTEVRQQLVQINNEWHTTTLRIAALIGELDQSAGIESP